MPKFETLSKEVAKQIEQAFHTGMFPDVRFHHENAVTRLPWGKDAPTVWRPAFAHDIDRIIHCPYYSRYADKTQVYSFFKNDDITRRSLHVQLVSRIARTIGSALRLNLDLIEAISLGHDIGHPPFAHTGEKFLDELYSKHTGRCFLHNLQSYRVLDKIFPYNITLQTLNGIVSHNGEIELEEYYPRPLESFEEFDSIIEKSYEDKSFALNLMPSTLEGSVVRLSDIISYLGKDRQDAMRANLAQEDMFFNEEIGSLNSEIINNLVVNIIENSYGKSYIKLDAKHFQALRKSKMDNYAMIYNNDAPRAQLYSVVRPMMEEVYEQLLDDFVHGKKNSPIFTHHIDYVNKFHCYRGVPYEKTEPNQMVVDYIASMTDDYFVELHKYLFPNSELSVEYKGYFDQ